MYSGKLYIVYESGVDVIEGDKQAKTVSRKYKDTTKAVDVSQDAVLVNKKGKYCIEALSS